MYAVVYEASSASYQYRQSREPYWCSVMLIVHSPPPAQQFFIDSNCSFILSTNDPGLFIANIMYHADAALEMSISRHILVIPTRCTIVGEAQSLPVTEMHIQQPLICTVEAYSSFCQGQKCVVVTHFGLQGEDAAVEAIRPSYVRGGREGRRVVE